MDFILKDITVFFHFVVHHKKFFILFVPILFMVFPIINRFNIIPSKLQAVIEMIYEFLEDQFRGLFKHDEDYKKWMPFFLTIFYYILIHNMLGLIPENKPVTSDINITASLAIMVFLISIGVGVIKHGPLKYLASLTPSGISLPFRITMFPIEVVSTFAKPFALAVRLFANMTAGHLIILSMLKLTEVFSSIFFVPVSITMAMVMMLFELFVCLIQAFIFAYLSAIYITDSIYIGNH
ncbi:MAG: F0F1 ATP synthase subunit A [Candidatus Margulisbacteria bacterium]|nr:F0F1 ATP synthase subunit A [Candidatus Margulisiibacteriota bacterium]